MKEENKLKLDKIKDYTYKRFKSNKCIEMYLFIGFYNVKEDIKPDIELVCEKLRINRTTALKRINELYRNGLLIKIPKGRKHLYEVITNE